MANQSHSLGWTEGHWERDPLCSVREAVIDTPSRDVGEHVERSMLALREPDREKPVAQRECIWETELYDESDANSCSGRRAGQ